jgi:hypothetical protein
MNIQKKLLNTAEFLGLCVAVNIQRVQGDPINQVYYVEGIQTGVVVKETLIKFGIDDNTELAKVIDISKIRLVSTPCIAAPNVVNAILYGHTTNAITEVMVKIFKQEIHAWIKADAKRSYPNCTVSIRYHAGPAKFTVCPQLDTYYCVELATVERNEIGQEVYGSQLVYRWKENGELKVGFRSELADYFHANDMLVSDVHYTAHLWTNFKTNPMANTAVVEENISRTLSAMIKAHGTPLLRSLAAEFGDGVYKNMLISQISLAELYHPVQLEGRCKVQPLELPQAQIEDIDMDRDISFVTEDVPTVLIDPVQIDNDAEITIVPVVPMGPVPTPISTPPPIPTHVETREVSTSKSRITVTVGDDYPPVPSN